MPKRTKAGFNRGEVGLRPSKPKGWVSGLVPLAHSSLRGLGESLLPVPSPLQQVIYYGSLVVGDAAGDIRLRAV